MSSHNYKRIKSKKRKILKAILWDTKPHECSYCKLLFQDKIEATVDHIVPKCRGGLDEIENLCLACKECNDKKANRNAKKFRRSLKKYL